MKNTDTVFVENPPEVLKYSRHIRNEDDVVFILLFFTIHSVGVGVDLVAVFTKIQFGYASSASFRCFSYFSWGWGFVGTLSA